MLPHLGLGGAQRVASCMATYWSECGHKVTLVTLMDTPPDFHRLDQRVERIRLPQPNGPLVRARRSLSARIEQRDIRAELMPIPASGPGRGEYRRLDGLRAAYRSLVRLSVAIVAFVTRHRLLGRSYEVYARLLRICYWRVRTVRRVFVRTNPDVVCSMLGATNIITVAASADLPHRTVISERNDPSKQRLETPWQDLRPVLYPAASAVSANSRGALASMRAYCPQGKLHHAPNPLILSDQAKTWERSNAMLFLGRLVRQKAPDVLIDAFARFARTRPEWTLHVAGDGPMAEELRGRARALGLTESVIFHGIVADPTPLFTDCRIFVLPSRFEGTPNALMEAMAHRMPCIVSDASPGPLRLIEDGSTGVVVKVDSVDALAHAMEKLSRDERLQHELGEAAFDRVQVFGIAHIGPVWDQILFPDEHQASA